MISPKLENEIVNMYAKLYDGVAAQDVPFAREQLYSLIYLVMTSSLNTIKRCGACRATYDVEGWLSLPLVGHQITMPMGGEMRNCQCGSTMLLISRRYEREKPKSNLFANTILDYKGGHTRPPFTLQECINMTLVYERMSHTFAYEKWDDRQVIEAATYAQEPKWVYDQNGNFIPYY